MKDKYLIMSIIGIALICASTTLHSLDSIDDFVLIIAIIVSVILIIIPAIMADKYERWFKR